MAPPNLYKTLIGCKDACDETRYNQARQDMHIDEIIQRLKPHKSTQGRRVFAIAGAPASGKSTLAEQLADKIENARVVPMDGFHRDNDDLERQGLLARKGAPETFDVAGFIEVVAAIKSTEQVAFPTFDRSRDCVVPLGGHLTATDSTILVEGNYLLLNTPPWRSLAAMWDFTVMLEVPLPVLQDRLVARWLAHDHTPAEALARAQRNDLPNAKRVMADSLPADLVISNYTA